MLALRTVLLLVVSWSVLLSAPVFASALTPSTVEEARLVARDPVDASDDVASTSEERSCPHCVLKRLPGGKQHRLQWHHKWQNKWQSHRGKKWQHKAKQHKWKQQKTWSKGDTQVFKAQEDDGNAGSSAKTDSDNGAGSSGLAQFAKGKLGLVWAMDQSHMKNFARDHVSWWYNWNAAPGGDDYPKDLTFCSMLWGEKKVQSYIDNVVNKPDSEANKGKCTLGMNERE